MAQHASLTLERWLAFSFDQRILMVANEMHRAAKLTEPDDDTRRANAYERVLALTDLTIQAPSRPAARRELLRWRDLVAGLYVQPAADPVAHAALLTCLLRFTPEASRQLGIG
jgi:hypothetical protein